MYTADRRRRWRTIEIGIAAFIVVVAVLALLLDRGAAPVPSAFNPAITLAQATDAAKASGRPVLVFATADWCGPCQQFKRDALADKRVNAWIGGNTEPVYLDVDKSRNDAMELGVMSIPTLILLRDGKVVDRHDGGMGTDKLIAWLTKAR